MGLELDKDGTGLIHFNAGRGKIHGALVTWEAKGGRLYLTSEERGDEVYDYKISGGTLTITYPLEEGQTERDTSMYKKSK